MSRVSFATAVRRESSLATVGLILVVPAVLVGVFMLPRPVRESLAFSHANPTAVTAYTAHFVHLSRSHLVANLAVYLLVTPVVYLTSVLGGQRRLFAVAFVTYLTVSPFALSALNLALPRRAVELGFSGVAMALFGLLPLSLSAFAATRLDDNLTVSESPAIFFITMAVAAVTAGPGDLRALAVALAALLSAALYSRSAQGQLGIPRFRRLSLAANRTGDFELATLSALLLFAVPIVAFRGGVTEAGTLNTYVHLLGFALGYIPAYLTLVVTDTETFRRG